MMKSRWVGLAGLLLVALLAALVYLALRPIATSGGSHAAVDHLAAANPLQSYRWQYQRMRADFISSDGRVIDLGSERSITTSEGQAYGMWFAVLADDQKTFKQLLQWTTNNLADGDLSAQLPAWLWGQRDDGNWGVLDSNSASDADIWMVAALFAAAESWQSPHYARTARALASLIIEQQTVALANQQRLLLPGAVGFSAEHEETGAPFYVVNPSYLKAFLFKAIAAHSNDKRWLELMTWTQNFWRNLTAHAQGVIPDWVAVDEKGQVLAAQEVSESWQMRVNEGSYDAIRAYLWLSLDHMAGRHDQVFAFDRLYQHTVKSFKVPERLLLDGSALGQGPIGFAAVTVVYLALLQEPEQPLSAAASQWALLASSHPQNYQARYFDTMLILFGLASLECGALSASASLNSVACALLLPQSQELQR